MSGRRPEEEEARQAAREPVQLAEPDGARGGPAMEAAGVPSPDARARTDSSGEPAAAPAEPPSGEPLAPKPRHRIRWLFSWVGLAVAAFTFGLLVFNYAVMPQLVHNEREVTVPDLSNFTLDQAERALAPLGLSLSRAGERYDVAVPRGFVISQDPPAGTPVRGKRRVSVVTSLGEEFSTVPELSGESQRGARLLLERAGLEVGPLVYAPSDEVGDGLVVGSDPGPDRVVPRGTPVALLISTGSPSEQFVMPELIGREIGGVRRQLEALGFDVVTPPSMPGIGTIVSQDPPAGSRIARRATILITATGRMIR